MNLLVLAREKLSGVWETGDSGGGKVILVGLC